MLRKTKCLFVKHFTYDAHDVMQHKQLLLELLLLLLLLKPAVAVGIAVVAGASASSYQPIVAFGVAVPAFIIPAQVPFPLFLHSPVLFPLRWLPTV